MLGNGFRTDRHCTLSTTVAFETQQQFSMAILVADRMRTLPYASFCVTISNIHTTQLVTRPPTHSFSMFFPVSLLRHFSSHPVVNVSLRALRRFQAIDRVDKLQCRSFFLFLLSMLLIRNAIRFSAIHSLLAASATCSVAASGGIQKSSNKSAAAFVVSNTGNLSSSTSSTATTSRRMNHNLSGGDGSDIAMTVDREYPGTAVARMLAARERVKQLHAQNEFTAKPWEDIRRKILFAGGLKDLPDARPGQGYTGHSFNDYNHVDLTCMADAVSNNENDGSVVKEIARGNLLGPGIRMASLTELGSGGSWSTCANGCNAEPPQDVAHIQFQSRIAFKLVWVPNERFDTFVLVDDDGNELARGTPTEGLPSLRQRQMNYSIMQGSKYAVAADKLASKISSE